jgi:hypothetical protein
MAYNAGSRVTVSGLVSKPELNDKTARVISSTTGANGMPRYMVQIESNGEQISLAPKNLIPISGSDDSGSGGGFGGFPGMPANLASMMSSVPPWLREKVLRGEKPTFADLNRLLGTELSPMHIGGVAVLFVILFMKVGFIIALATCSVLG